MNQIYQTHSELSEKFTNIVHLTKMQRFEGFKSPRCLQRKIENVRKSLIPISIQPVVQPSRRHQKSVTNTATEFYDIKSERLKNLRKKRFTRALSPNLQNHGLMTPLSLVDNFREMISNKKECGDRFRFRRLTTPPRLINFDANSNINKSAWFKN
jgi:hypothetical protein